MLLTRPCLGNFSNLLPRDSAYLPMAKPHCEGAGQLTAAVIVASSVQLPQLSNCLCLEARATSELRLPCFHVPASTVKRLAVPSSKPWSWHDCTVHLNGLFPCTKRKMLTL